MTKPVRAFATRYQCFCAGFGFTADYSFVAVYGFIAVACNLVVTFGNAHWAEMIRPQRCKSLPTPKARHGKARSQDRIL